MDVLTEETDGGHKYLQVQMGNGAIWVLAERTRELAENDPGTPHPGQRPAPQPAPKEPEPAPQPEKPQQPEEKPLAPQPTNEDIVRGLSVNKGLLEKILAVLNKIAEFLTGIFKGFNK